MRNIFIIVLILAALVSIGIWYNQNQESGTSLFDTRSQSTIVKRDVMELVMDFYNPWLDAVASTTTDPYQDELVNNALLTPDAREKIFLAQADSSVTHDPVLCQTAVPERVGTRIVYEQDAAAEVAVLARNGTNRSTDQALVRLQVIDGEWRITDIRCVFGEGQPKREFTFEQEGYLLKDSLPKTMDRQHWHLVYQQQGQSGYTVPLFFARDSICIAKDGNESTCVSAGLQEASRVFVQGQMQEAGLDVVRLQIMPSE